MEAKPPQRFGGRPPCFLGEVWGGTKSPQLNFMRCRFRRRFGRFRRRFGNVRCRVGRFRRHFWFLPFSTNFTFNDDDVHDDNDDDDDDNDDDDDDDDKQQ